MALETTPEAYVQRASAPPPRSREMEAAVQPPQPPQRVALAESAGPSAPLPKNPPLPPQRPFDLGTIPGADVPVSVARR
jgi:rare lipoprotein A